MNSALNVLGTIGDICFGEFFRLVALEASFGALFFNVSTSFRSFLAVSFLTTTFVVGLLLTIRSSYGTSGVLSAELVGSMISSAVGTDAVL